MTFFFTFSKLFQKVQIPRIVQATDIYLKRNQTFFLHNNQFHMREFVCKFAYN